MNTSPIDSQVFEPIKPSCEREEPSSDGDSRVGFWSSPAVIARTTYQLIHHPEAERRWELAEHARFLVRRSLELIRDRSTLNVRILTRSALARRDFDLFQTWDASQTPSTATWTEVFSGSGSG